MSGFGLSGLLPNAICFAEWNRGTQEQTEMRRVRWCKQGIYWNKAEMECRSGEALTFRGCSLEQEGLRQGKQVRRGIQGSSRVGNPGQSSRMTRRRTGDRDQSQSGQNCCGEENSVRQGKRAQQDLNNNIWLETAWLSRDYNLAVRKWQGWVFVEVLITEQVAAGGDLLWLQHTCLPTHNHTYTQRERVLGKWWQVKETQDEQ
jgi:hypothetical protein